MPIVDVNLVTRPNSEVAPELAQLLANAVGRTLRSPPGQTWVRLHLLSQEHYAENESLVQPSEFPVFVTVLKRATPAGAQWAAEVTALTSAVAGVLGCPASCVHIEYAPAASGRLSFGGKLVE